MKRNPFYKPSGLFLTALLLVFSFTSCKKQATDLRQSTEESASAKASLSTALPTYSLKVTVDNSSGNKITSDGLGDYTNGSQNVQAIIDKYGNFIFTTNTITTRTPSRTLNFDFSNVINQFSTPPATNTSKSYTLETLASTVSGIPFTPLQNLGINGNPTTECVSFRGRGVTNNTIEWRTTFHAGFEDRIDNTTAFGLVTRINATQWTITALGNCASAIPNKAALRSGNAQTLYGYYNLPVSLTLTKQ